MNEYPTVSVIVSTFKRPALLRRQLDSLLGQTFKDFEVIVCHDGPAEEDTQRIGEEYEGKFYERDVPFMLIHAGDEPSGYYCVPCNVSIGFARGDYYLFVDDDNEVPPNAISSLVAAIEEGEVWPDLVYGKRKYVLDPGCPPEKDGQPLGEGESPFVPWSEAAKEHLGESWQNNFIDKADALVSRGAVWMMAQQTGMCWNEDYRRLGDYEFFVRGLHLSGWRAKAIDEVVNIYHWHGKNVQLTRALRETPTAMTLDVGVGGVNV